MRLIIEENDAKAGLWTARYIVARIGIKIFSCSDFFEAAFFIECLRRVI